MTTNKPKVLAWLHSVRQDSDVITDKVRHVWGTPRGSMGEYTEPLIRLSDYDALAAENERLRADYNEACDDAMEAVRKLRAELDAHKALQAECEKLVQALRRISYQASRHECRQTPTSDLQRAFADIMRQADDALYCFYNDMLHKQRFCEYAGCCEPAVAEALCHAHLEDWREQQAIDAAHDAQAGMTGEHRYPEGEPCDKTIQ